MTSSEEYVKQIHPSAFQWKNSTIFILLPDGRFDPGRATITRAISSPGKFGEDAWASAAEYVWECKQRENASRKYNLLSGAKPLIRLEGGRWYAFKGRKDYKNHLLVPAISFCDRLNQTSNRGQSCTQ